MPRLHRDAIYIILVHYAWLAYPTFPGIHSDARMSWKLRLDNAHTLPYTYAAFSPRVAHGDAGHAWRKRKTAGPTMGKLIAMASLSGARLSLHWRKQHACLQGHSHNSCMASNSCVTRSHRHLHLAHELSCLVNSGQVVTVFHNCKALNWSFFDHSSAWASDGLFCPLPKINASNCASSNHSGFFNPDRKGVRLTSWSRSSNAENP